MRRIMALLGSRYGIAVVLAVVVLAIVGGTRTLTGGEDLDPIGPVLSPPPPSDSQASASTSPAIDDDGADPEPTEPASAPSLAAGALDATATASNFTTAWLKNEGISGDQWRAGLAPFATPALLTKLKDADPASVPASTITGSITVQERDSYSEAIVPVNGGSVLLRLVAEKGRWLVDAVDWRPS